MPSLQFLSSEVGDAKWLIWGKILHRKGTRGTRYPDPDVLVKITDTGVIVQRSLPVFYYSGMAAAACASRSVSISSFAITQTYFATDSLRSPDVPGAGYIWTFAGPDGSNLLVTGNDARDNPYPSGLTGDIGTKIIKVMLSDGTEIGSVRQIQTVGASVAFNPTYVRKSNNIISSVWNGGGYVDTYDRLDTYSPGGIVSTFTTGRIVLDVPADAAFAPSGVPSLPAELGTTFPTWIDDWAAAQAVGVIRERARLKACSDALKTVIKSGVLPDQIKGQMRDKHPKSSGTGQAALMTASVVDVASGSGDDITNTKVVTLSYQSMDGDGNPITLQEVVTGSQHVVATHCADSAGVADQASYTTTTYTNWLPISDNGSTGSALDLTYQLDDSSGLAQIWDGVVVDGAAGVATTFDVYGGVYSPPYPQSSSALTISYPSLYIEYRAATQRIYTPTGEASALALILDYTGFSSIEDLLDDEGYGTVAEMFSAYGVSNFAGLWRAIRGITTSEWCDSIFKSGESIDVFPLSVIHSEHGDMGMFPQASDIEAPKISLRADTKATYTYSYKTGVWTGSGADITPITTPYQAGVNLVFRSHTIPWPDVSYTDQAASIRAAPSSYPLFAPLLAV